MPGPLGGGNIRAAIERTVALLGFCREHGLPVAHTRVVFADDGSDHNLMSEKVPALKRLTESAPDSQIVAELAPAAGELVVRKRNASAFFETDYGSWLTRRRADTLLIAGCTTSGWRARHGGSMRWALRLPADRRDRLRRRPRPRAAPGQPVRPGAEKYADLMSAEEGHGGVGRARAGRRRIGRAYCSR